jgi:hypothetical protein
LEIQSTSAEQIDLRDTCNQGEARMSDISPVFWLGDILGVRIDTSGLRAEKKTALIEADTCNSKVKAQSAK